MKIGVIISSLSFGGAEKQAVLDANLLAEKHDVFFFYFDNGPMSASLSTKVVVERIKKEGYLKTAGALRKRLLNHQVNILHASLFAPIVISTLATIGTKIKVVWHFHSHEYDLPLKSRLAFSLLSGLPHVRKILFVNRELLDHFSSLRFPVGKTGIQYNHSEAPVILPKVGKPSGRTLRIGYLGRVVELKRVHYLVDLAKYLRNREISNFEIHIVGDGEALEEVKKLAVEKEVTHLLVFHGFQADILSHYRKFDFFVNPSREECLSIAMIDAGMTGLPVVAFAVGGNDEIVVHGTTGFIVDNKDAFFQKCLLLARDEPTRRRLGSEALQHCRRLFSREQHARQLEDLYEEILHAS
jgi:glycosyltransferase involved in cell wall biosynthesis